MKIKKVWLGVLALMVVFGAGMSGETLAATAPQQETSARQNTKAPIVVEGDQLFFDDQTGEMFAQGSVKVTQNDEQVLADKIRGNTKQSAIWVDGTAVFRQPGVDLKGNGIFYNYRDRQGDMKDAGGTLDVGGTVKKMRVFGQDITARPQELTVGNGWVTGCPSPEPHYRVSAERIEIWPGDKMIAYNAKFWINKTVIFVLPRYEKSLDAGNTGSSSFPNIGYYSQDGMYIRQHLAYTLHGNLSAYTDLNYYTKTGFKPDVGLLNATKTYSLGVTYGDYRDGNGNWIKKEPEFDFNLKDRRIGTTPVSYNFSAAYGKWSDSAKTSWHQDYTLYFSRDPVKVSNNTSLYLGAGLERTRESYDGSTQNLVKYDAAFNTEWSPRFSTSVSYHYRQNNNSLFDYGRADMARELDTGFSYKMDKMNTLIFNQSYDVQNHHVYDQDYTLERKWDCFAADITYRAKRHEVQVHVHALEW